MVHVGSVILSLLDQLDDEGGGCEGAQAAFTAVYGENNNSMIEQNSGVSVQGCADENQI